MQKKVENKNSRQSVSNTVTLDPKNPIPYEPTGGSEAFGLPGKNKRYLPFLAPKDNFFQLLFEAKLLSPTNLACVNSKTLFCNGNGFIFGENDDKKSIEAFQEWVKRVNNKGQNFRKLMKSVFNNHFTVGNNFVEIIRGKIGSDRFIKVINRSFLDCRLSDPNDDDIAEYVFISKMFRGKNGWDSFKENKAVKLPIYYGQDLKKFKWYVDPKQKTEHCIIHLKNDMPGYEHYGMPENVASLPWQILEYKGARYNLDNFENNLVIGGIVFVSGNLTTEQARKVGKDIIYTHTGDGKRGRWAVVSGQDIDAVKSGFQSFDVHQEGSFIEQDENAESKIINSNNWDAALFGNHEKSGLGNGGFAYLNAIYEIKKKTVIKPTQDQIKEDLFIPLFRIYDDWTNSKFSDLNLEFQEVSPITVIGDVAVNKIITRNEGRKAIGMGPMEDEEAGKKIIEENLKTQNNVQNQQA